MTVPANPKIYHIVHHDRLPSITADGFLFSDAQMIKRQGAGTSIGIDSIKMRRLKGRNLTSHPDLKVGECAPFYFCPRSVMLYVICCKNHGDLAYKGGQQPIVHLEADLKAVVAWADGEGQRWAFTLSNAGSHYFEDRCDLAQLDQINWQAVQAKSWADNTLKEGKQAEFLIERACPWHLIDRIGVYSKTQVQPVMAALANAAHKPAVEIQCQWYY